MKVSKTFVILYKFNSSSFTKPYVAKVCKRLGSSPAKILFFAIISAIFIIGKTTQHYKYGQYNDYRKCNSIGL